MEKAASQNEVIGLVVIACLSPPGEIGLIASKIVCIAILVIRSVEITDGGFKICMTDCALHKVFVFLVSYAGMKGIVVAVVGPQRFRIVTFIPVVHDPETVANTEDPWPVGIVKLQVEVVVEILFAVETWIIYVQIINLPSSQHPKVFGEYGETEFRNP